MLCKCHGFNHENELRRNFTNYLVTCLVILMRDMQGISHDTHRRTSLEFFLKQDQQQNQQQQKFHCDLEAILNIMLQNFVSLSHYHLALSHYHITWLQHPTFH